MDDYTHALKNIDALTLQDTTSIVDFTSPTSQRFLDKLKRDRYVSKVSNNWVDLLMANGVNYIFKSIETKVQSNKVIVELESKLNTWEAEKAKWDEYYVH